MSAECVSRDSSVELVGGEIFDAAQDFELLGCHADMEDAFLVQIEQLHSPTVDFSRSTWMRNRTRPQ
jgi:hypothetical protein